jgi:hypothetical protein
MARTSYFRWDDYDVRFVLNQHAELDLYSTNSLKQQSTGYFYSTNSLKQQSTGRHVATLGHIILISNQPVFNCSCSSILRA